MTPVRRLLDPWWGLHTTLAMMNIAFLDAVGWDYDVATPYERPLGGSQSALAYLAAELARRGSRVTFYGGTTRPREVMGVTCVSTLAVTAGSLQQTFDALIVLNGPAELCLALRPRLDPTTPLVLWTQHAHDQPAMQALLQPEVRRGWDAVACVSDWQRASMIDAFGLDPARVVVLRNAISPLFEGLFSDRDELARTKGSRTVLSYTSTPFRGLNVLISIFPATRAEFPDVELQVFSSMQVYQQDEPDDAFATLYEHCRTTPGIRYVGSLPQSRLADVLRSASVLAYPNIFAETSCISVMEAMAAGLQVVTTDLGALPETLMGFGTLVAPVTAHADIAEFARTFFHRLIGVLRDRASDPSGFAAARFAQVVGMNAVCTWRARAPRWEKAILGWKRDRASGIDTLST